MAPNEKKEKEKEKEKEKKDSNLTEYERKRMENIRRNQEMIASLNVQSTLFQLTSFKHPKREGSSSKSYYKVSSNKKLKTSQPSSPIVIRRSLRARGIAPDSKGLFDDSPERPPPQTLPIKSLSPREEKPSPRVLGPYCMRDAYNGSPGSDRPLIHTILSVMKKPQKGFLVEEEIGELEVVKEEKFDGFCVGSVKEGVMSEEVEGCGKKEFGTSCIDLESFNLESENVARVVPGRIMAVKFFPRNDLRMVVVGNKFGNVGFWNVDHKREEGGQDTDGIYLYRPHTGPVSGILFQQHGAYKMYTSCYNGFLRVLDAEKEVFSFINCSEEAIFSLSQQPNGSSSLYFGEGHGGLNVWDVRAGKSSSQWLLHEDRINSIDFNPQNPNIMVTSSTDATACIWDLRSVNAEKPNCLKTVNHKRAVYSAYFSPSGSLLATTSLDDRVGLLTGVNFEDADMIYHNNQTGRWLSTFKATWGWDDSYVFVGSMRRGVDVISPAAKRLITTLQSPNMSAIPCRFDAHPSQVGMLAAATSGGQVYIWTST